MSYYVDIRLHFTDGQSRPDVVAYGEEIAKTVVDSTRWFTAGLQTAEVVNVGEPERVESIPATPDDSPTVQGGTLPGDDA